MLLHQVNKAPIQENDSTNFIPIDFAKMRNGLQYLDDASLNLGVYKKVNSNYGNKAFILNTIYQKNFNTMREISEYFYQSSGIYQRLCRYIAYLYRYDWHITTYMVSNNQSDYNKSQKDLASILEYFDNSNIKLLSGDIALEIIKFGVYYGFIMDFGDSFTFQQLPAAYCRSRFKSKGLPVVELNMRFFDACFRNPKYRLQVLDLFPNDIKKAYIMYKEGKLRNPSDEDQQDGWYMLAPGTAVCLSLGGSLMPPLFNVIPSIIDLDQGQDLDRKKTMQQLLKIIVQKLPRDKNGDLIFDMVEAKDIHNNAVQMLKGRSVGIDVLTTFADIEKIDTKDNNSTTTTDDLQKLERSVYNAAGTAKNIFNSEGNLATTNSILNDESNIRDLVLQLQNAFNMMTKKFNRKNHYKFTFNMLETTQYNYKDISKMYKEHASIGFSKVLPQIALGHSQSSILATAQFENEVLHLSEVMIPPQSSYTTTRKELDNSNQLNSKKSQEQQEVGRPEKDDTEKSDKTIANRESL